MSVSINGSGSISGIDQGLNVTGISTFSDLTISGAGTTKSGWFSTLDSKSDFDNVSFLLEPDSVFDFSSSKSAAENYYPALFTSALTSANTTYLAQLIGGRFNTNVAGTDSSSSVRAYGAIFSARRNSTIDVSSSTSNQLYGSQSFVIQGANVSDSVNTEIAFGEASAIYHNKGNITKAYSHAAELSIAGGSNEQVNTNITDAELVGYRHASTIGNSGSGISTISQYNFFESNATVFSSARISDVCGVKLGFTAPFAGTVERYKAIDIGSTAGPALQYSIYSPSDSVSMYHQGNIGIGTTNANTPLYIQGSSSSFDAIRLSGDIPRKNTIGVNGADNLVISVDEDAEGNGSNFRLRVDGAETLRSTFNRIGVGTANDSGVGTCRVYVRNDNITSYPVLRLENAGGTGGQGDILHMKTARGDGTIDADLVKLDLFDDTEIFKVDNAGTVHFRSGCGTGSFAALPVYGVRAWINFSNSGGNTTRASGGVLTRADDGVGDYTITFDFTMPDANFFAIADSGNNSTWTSNRARCAAFSRTTTSASFTNADSPPGSTPSGGTDREVNYVAFIR